MAKERVEFDPAIPETSCLGRITTVAPTGYFIGVTPELFPLSFRDQPEMFEQYSRRAGSIRLYTYHHHQAKPLSLADLLKLPHHQVDPAELAFRQTVTSYPSLAIKPVDWRNAPKIYGEEPVAIDSNEGQEFIASHFTEEEKGIDLTKGSPSISHKRRLTDSAVNTYFAFHLVMLQEFPTPDELIKYTRQRGIAVDLSRLHNGFIRLVAKSTVRQLTTQGLMEPELIDAFYDSAADWLKMVALKRVTQRRSNEVISPYPTHMRHMRKEQHPEIRFLPYIVRTLYDFLLDLPLHIAEGRQYPHQDVLYAVGHLNSLMEEIICENIKDEIDTEGESQLPDLLKLVKQKPQMVEDIVKVNQQLRAFSPAYGKILRLFQKSPGLLNKIRPDRSSEGVLPSYQLIRGELLAAGGRAPRKPLNFRVAHGAASRQGQI